MTMIPESQLETWSNQGAVTTARATHKSIRGALESHEWPEGAIYDIYLQGSYRNSTNIRGDSDVDVVAQLDSVFASNLSPDEKSRLGLGSATYGWRDFKSDVLKALIGCYGTKSVRMGNKSIKIEPDRSRLPADIVVAIKYRRYSGLTPVAEGMTFWAENDGRQIINYPKLHYENGVKKHADTDGWYKPAVRLFKNARECAIEKRLLADGVAPSYFVESLLYNVPDGCFGERYQLTYLNVLEFLGTAPYKDGYDRYVCQNGQLPLFGTTAEQWSTDKAKAFLNALSSLWKNWS